MEGYLEQFEDYLVNEKKSSANTVQSYMRDVRAFVASSKRSSAMKVTGLDMEDYFSSLSNEKSESSVQRARASLNAYFAFLIRIGAAKSNPVKKVRLGPKINSLPDTLSMDKVTSLLSSPDDKTPKGLRDKAMLELLYATGIKTSELITLDISDVNTKVGYVTCRSENNTRMIPIYPKACRTIQKYITNVRPALVSDEKETALFLNSTGSRLTRQGFWKIVKKCAENAGIEEDITPQTLRHSFALHLLQNGADLKTIQEMLGHSDISTTQVYARMFQRELKSKYNKFHPLAR